MIQPAISTSPRFAPGPEEFPDLWQNPLQVLIEASRQYGHIVCLDPYEHQIYLVTHPDWIKHVLQDNHRNYRRDADSFKLLVGNGLIANNGGSWLRQRRLMQPAFHRQQIADLSGAMVGVVTNMVERWRPLVNTGQPLDILAEMMQLTTHIIVKTMFSLDGDEEIEAAAQAMAIGQDYIYELGWDYLGEHKPDPTRFEQALDTLDRIVYRVIDERSRTNLPANDLLAMLLAARDEETGQGMSRQQLRDEIVGIFGAGRDTTAITLAWSWYLLATHPEVETRLRIELAAVLGRRLPGYEDLPRLAYTRRIIEEALRLYPPGWMTARLSLAEDRIGGYDIPANAEIFLSPYVTQRHPDFWDEPDCFDPDRFLPDRAASRPRFADFPFGGGPRVCIGNNFAMVEAQLALATIAQSYRLCLKPEQRVEPEVRIILQPRGLLMTLHR
jgi:cytochrome P450